MSITKELISTGLTGNSRSVILSDGITDVILNASAYSDFRIKEGMSDKNIFDFATKEDVI